MKFAKTFRFRFRWYNVVSSLGTLSTTELPSVNHEGNLAELLAELIDPKNTYELTETLTVHMLRSYPSPRTHGTDSSVDGAAPFGALPMPESQVCYRKSSVTRWFIPINCVTVCYLTLSQSTDSSAPAPPRIRKSQKTPESVLYWIAAD